jgi:HD-GYP domain-containing protein (c-di-GMP phosphodiesterase class II)/DNA-binding CsgD family transcriptional regulator
MAAQIRVAEVLAALSLTTDLGTGMPFEKGLRTCVLAMGFADALGLGAVERRAVFEAALLRSIGCTSHAPENAALFEDDTAFQHALHTLDAAQPDVFAARFGAWSPRQPRLVERVVAETPVAGVRAWEASCEVSAALGVRLGLSPPALAALEDVYERWDGAGLPGRHAGEAIPLVARVCHVAEQAVIWHGTGGRAAADAELRRRAGGHLDPELCARFLAAADELLAALDAPDMLDAVAAAEPEPIRAVPAARRDELLTALAIFADLKGTHLAGHSLRVRALATAAAELSGLDAAELSAAALVHDIGRTGVNSAIWDRPGPLGPGDRERVRLHPYWTERVIERCPALVGLAPLAAAHHERLDGSGYHRAARAAALPPAARLLAAADAFAAMTEDRPYRPALASDVAARALLEEVAAGRLDPGAARAVVEAAGLPRPRVPWPGELTDREVDVLRLCARGLTNREIADRLVVSARTVQHHLAAIYDKTGRRTRAGAAVFAVEHGLVE